jgi:RimJ/RimL family protein N-acetyltransferase
MTIEVRPIRAEDIESFHATVDVVARERKFIARLEAPPIEQVRAFILRNIEKGCPQFVAVAVADGQVVGWCNIPPMTRDVAAHVGDLFMGLRPAWRGRGLGERLLREALAAADAFGYRRIELGVFAGNANAAALYRKAGFIEEGIKRRAVLIDGVFHDEIIMARLRD